MEEKQQISIPYIAFESAQTRLEIINRRLCIICIILIIALIGTNAGWLYYESQFEDTVVEQEIDAQADGDSDIDLQTIGGDYNGREGSY